jgi:hypothetical protein
LFLARSGEGLPAIELTKKAVVYAEQLATVNPVPQHQGWLARAEGLAALVYARADLRAEAAKLAVQSVDAQSRIPEESFTDWPASERAQVKALADGVVSN